MQRAQMHNRKVQGDPSRPSSSQGWCGTKPEPKIRTRTITNSSSETTTCVTSLKRRSRRISQQMLALLSSHKDEHQEHLRSGQTDSQIWPSATVSRITLSTMDQRTARSNNNSGDIFDQYTRNDAQRDGRVVGYPPQQYPGHRVRPPRPGHTPSSSISSSKHSREPQKQPTTSPTKPMGPRAPNQLPSLRIPDDRSPRRLPGTATDTLDNRRAQLAELDFSYAENSPHSSSAAISLRNLGQPSSAPPTGRYPPEGQQHSRRNQRPAIVLPQDMPPSQYFHSHPSSPPPSTPASAPAVSTSRMGSVRVPPTPRSRPTTERGTTPTGRLPATSPQAAHHHRAISDGTAGGFGPNSEPRRAQTNGGIGVSSAHPRSPRDVGAVGGGAVHRAPEPARPSQHTRNPSGQSQSSGSEYGESGQYATIDHPHSQPQQQQQQQQGSRDQTSFDEVAAPFSLGPVPRSQRQGDYSQQQTTQQPTPMDLTRAESTRQVLHGEAAIKAKTKAKNSWQGAPDLRGSIADLWTSAVTAAEEEHRLEQLQKSNGPLSSGSSGVLTSISEPSSYPSSVPPSSVPSLAHLPSFGLSGRPGSRSGRENHTPPHAHVPQVPSIVHSNPSSPYDQTQNHHVTISIPPVFTQAGPLPSPPRHIDVVPSSPPPPPPRPTRIVTHGSISAAPSNVKATPSAHGSTSSIPLKRPVSPHKPHTPPSPARPPPIPLARPPSPLKSPPPPLSVSPAKSVPPPPPPREASPIKAPVPLPLSPASSSTNTGSTKSLSVFARGSASPTKPPPPLPPLTTSKSAPAPAPALPSPPKPPAALPDPITKTRPLSPQPQPLVKPLQLRTKNTSGNNSPLPPPPMQLPPPPTGEENNRDNMNATRENANKVVPPPRSRERLVLPRAASDYSIVAVSEGASDDDEEHDKVMVEVAVQARVEVAVQVKGLQAVDKGEEHAGSSGSEYSGSESPASKVTSSTVAVAPTPSPPKLQLEGKTTGGSPGSLHIREGAESMFLQMHRVVNVGVEQAKVTTPKKDTSVLEGLDTTPTPGNVATAGNRGKVEPSAPVPVPVPAPVFSRRKEEVAHPPIALAPYQPPPKSQLEPRVELRPISLGLIKDDDIMFHFSEAENIRLASALTTETPQPVNYGRKDARATPRAASPKRSMSVKKPPVVLKDVRPAGHARKRDAVPSSGSEYEGHIHGHRSHPNEENRTPARLPDFGNPFATPSSSSSSRPQTATTVTTSSASATGHASSLPWGPPPRKRSTRGDRGRSKRTTIVARYVDGSNLGHGVEGDVEDAGDDDDEDDDEFDVETEHGRVLKKLVKGKGSWPSAMSFHDVLSEPTTSARAQGYATKLNALYREDCGLGDWIEVWLKPKLFAGQLDIQPSGMSAHNRVTSGASVFSDTTFPMRVDAFRAIDLSPGAGGGPTELGDGPPPLPYPSLAMRQLQQGSAYNPRSNVHTTINLLPPPKKSTGFFSSLGRKASMKSKVPGDSSGQENREKRRKLSRPAPSASSTSQLGHFSDIGNSSSNLVPLAPSIVGGPRAPPGKPKRASTVLVIGPPQLIHPPPPAQYPLKPSKRSSLDAFMSATSSSSTVALNQPMAFRTNIVPPAPEGPRLVTRTPSFPGHSSSSSSINRGNGLTPPDANVKGGGSNGPERHSKLRQAVSYQPPRQPSDNGQFEKSLDKLCAFMPDLEREVLADYLRQADGQEMIAVGRIVDARKRGAVARP